MRKTVIPLYDKKQTAEKIHYLINRYYNDLKKIYVKKSGKIIPISKLSLFDFFNLVKYLPYKRDEKPIETVARPLLIVKNRKGGIDCKKKAVLMGAYLKNRGLKYRLMSVSNRPSGRIHHVFIQGLINGSFKNLDSTYKHYFPFQKKRVTNAEII